MTACLTIAAPAKINLFLHVLGRRADGYHLLDSLIAFAAFGDRLDIAPAAGFSLTIEGPFAAGLSAGDDNLVLRAARALAAHVQDRRAGATIRLIKNLPVASGIGGGSSDAAATLRALDVLWHLGTPDTELAEIGLGLGADMPVCLFGRTARVGGIGESVAPGPSLPSFGLLLVNPGLPVPTGAVFKRLQDRFSPPAAGPVPLDMHGFAAWLGGQRNDLAAAATAVAPAIATVISALGASEGCLLARLSGSGATCFGLYPDSASADAAARRLRTDHPDWWIVATRFADTAPRPQGTGTDESF